MANITVTSARTSLERRKHDISDVSSSLFLEWCNNVNKFLYRELYKLQPEQYISRTTVSVVSDTATYTLPSDIKNITVKGCGLFEVDSNSVDTNVSLRKTSFGSRYRGYYLTSSDIVLTPTPKKAETLAFRYIPTYTELTGVSSEFVLDDEYLEYIVNALDVQYSIWDEDENAEISADSRFIRSLDDLLSNINVDIDSFEQADTSDYYI